VNVKATKTNATRTDAPSSELWDVKLVTVNAESKDAVTLLLAENATDLKVIAKLAAPERNWVLLLQVTRALATKNIGVAYSVSKSKRALRWVRSLHVSWLLVRNLKHPKRWETFALSR
jgi:UDP-N-acetyl-D-mannosaminuronic acid transferase (WecB/TagA/CpsF family)